MTDRGRDLAAAIDGLYAAFEHYARPATFAGCPCDACWGTDIVESPGGDRPLRTLRPDELEDIAADVPHVGGDIALYKHYLPRLYEIAVTDGFDHPDLPILLPTILHPKDAEFRWTLWPAAEQAAIRRFFRSLWRDRLAAADDIDGIDDVLAGLAGADPDVDWYLAEWLRFEQPTAVFHLEAFLARYAPTLMTRPRRRRLAEPIVAWIRSPATKAAVDAAADRATSPEEREALAEIYLRWLP